jgi:GxxExxY protein
MTLSRAISRLPAATKALIERVIGCCIDVHRELGPGLSEIVYASACSVELEARGIPHEREKSLPVVYRGRTLCNHRVDLLVDGQLVVEIKAVERLHPVHLAQTVSYLRLTGASVGLVINFNSQALRLGIRRVVL